eukprot:TRINITY_DN15448_c0_g1_i2.p2 TRINITY_DN15448_c0_g1~~TRINITY_DN15448_c0_g1_i2.p2  ORF type:complete len:103 (-),score=1.42 TRINITY_DN15448_c0_g1_i2:714-1022(-)
MCIRDRTRKFKRLAIICYNEYEFEVCICACVVCWDLLGDLLFGPFCGTPCFGAALLAFLSQTVPSLQKAILQRKKCIGEFGCLGHLSSSYGREHEDIKEVSD